MIAPFNLQRFVEAQDPVFAEVCAELRSGRKQSHWMWFIFPQIEGLGHSSLARKFAVSGLPEAEAYLNHELLGPRLRDCTRLVTAVQGRSILNILGAPDHLKFRSSMTLFSHATSDNQEFTAALAKYFGGEPDQLTLKLLQP